MAEEHNHQYEHSHEAAEKNVAVHGHNHGDETAAVSYTHLSAVHSVNSNLYKQIHTVGMLTCHASMDTLATPSQGNLVL